MLQYINYNNITKIKSFTNIVQGKTHDYLSKLKRIYLLKINKHFSTFRKIHLI